MAKSIIIIGAGIAGLSAGCYSQMNDYNTQIFEMHTIPGGLCTSWKRKGYLIDGCIEYLEGTGPGSTFYHFWEELGAIQDRTIIHPEEWSRVEGKDGKVLTFYTDIDKLEQHMKELAPEDTEIITEIAEAIRARKQFKDIPPEKAPEVMGAIDGLKMIARMSSFLKLRKKWGKISIQDFAKSLKSPFLREVLPYVFSFPSTHMFGMLLSLGLIQQKNAGYPLGGSLKIARAIEKRYSDLGGEIHYKSKVAKILVENDKAVGVQLVDGSEHRADIILSAGDGHTTIFDMLDGKYINKQIKDSYSNYDTMPPLVYVALGVNRLFDEPSSVFGMNFKLDKTINIAGQELTRLPVHIYNFDPGLAPKGKTVLTVKIPSDYEYWKQLRNDRKRYKTEKDQIAKNVIDILDQRFSGLASQVEMYDVSTPATFERYTGNWQGSYMGWAVTPEAMNMKLSKTLPGLRDFYMAGHWVSTPGGTPSAALSGRYVTQIICNKDKKQFVTTTP